MLDFVITPRCFTEHLTEMKGQRSEIMSHGPQVLIAELIEVYIVMTLCKISRLAHNCGSKNSWLGVASRL